MSEAQSRAHKRSAEQLDRRELLAALRALRRGEFDARLPKDAPGIDGQICDAFNDLCQFAESMRADVSGLRQTVGVEGRTHRRLSRSAARGGWASYVTSVNEMLDDVTAHTTVVAGVLTAVAKGDLSQSIDLDGKDLPLRGDFLRHARLVNGTVAQLGAISSEVTRVAQEVAVEGKLGAQARIRGVAGVWKELTDSVNSMASNLTDQVREIARVTTAVASGDLTKTVSIEAKGELLELKNTINTMVAQLGSFSSEVTRVAREVGTDGVLGGQAHVVGVSGVWRELTENVNFMASNLTSQVRNIAEVITAIAQGELGQKITVDAKGEFLTVKNTINSTVDTLNRFAEELNRMARLLGTEGTLGVQADVRDVSGVWKELTDNVNSMGRNLTDQVRDIAAVTTSVAKGDLSKKITVEVQGELLELKNTTNAMVDSLASFAAEVSRMAREVGTDGVLGGQAVVRDVSGIWLELTQNVNSMASNLTNQVRNVAEVARAVANGDLSKKITVDAHGEVLELKSILNAMVDQLNAFSEEVTRLATEVGTEGKLGGQADVRGVSGTWRHLTDAVNSMAGNLTDQVRNISQVATAIAQGDLQKKIVVDARGEILELKSTINTMVDQLSMFAEQVTRVAREVGTEGKLGGQASIEGVRGVWKELTDNVNQMATNLTNQVRDISQVATAIAQGDLSRKIAVEVRGELLDLKNVINTMVDQLSAFADQVTRVARDVGVEGKLGGQAEVRGVLGVWKELTDNVNLMASNLTGQVRDIANVTTAVANGDLTRKITVDVKGELFELKRTINTMVDQLNAFAAEVTRVAREVGTEGMLGGQAEVRGVSGVWRDLTDNVNLMARNLTEQVRGIAHVVTAVANGDLDQKLTLAAKGEIATLVDTINAMTVTLSTFAEQVTGVARDVGVEGKLGGQADVPGAAGVWRDLTNNVNELAGNLTRQVRAIGDVATAVTKGDLTQSITVDARGEVALLKDNVNQMIGTLAETTRVNQEQDWLKTNLTRFTRMLQGQRDLLTVADQVLTELAAVVNAQHGSFFMADTEDDDLVLKLFAGYAYKEHKNVANTFRLGEGLVGQAAREKKRILVSDVPSDYVRISSSLGDAAPLNLVVVPISFEGEIKGVLELASFQRFTLVQLAFLEQLVESLGIVIATIRATMRTSDLLRQSQSMAEELKTQQLELQQTNEELEEKARQLTTQKSEVERKNVEVELAKQELEEKAEQLAMTSRYKSQFLANMSHELRTPLNSLLILSRQLSDNRDHNLTDRQLEFARTIHQSGADLLALINEILDLAKIESGTMSVDATRVAIADLTDYVDSSFRHVAEEKHLSFVIDVAAGVPEFVETDDMRLRQVLRNLLSNALKFTDKGSVQLRLFVPPRADWSVDNERLNSSKLVVGFSVSDTGIGIPKDQQRIIFEAFQQADGGTSRKYGGTGLGLAISREIAGLLGGELRVQSEAGTGSVFTLYVPANFVARSRPATTAARSGGQPAHLLALESEAREPGADPVRHALSDDRHAIKPGDRVLLVIEDDEAFGRTLLDSAREHAFKGVVVASGSQGLEFARTLQPDAITLDLRLPDMDGWVVLDQLKHGATTRHIPVHVISALDDERRGLDRGALAFLRKPAELENLTQALQRLDAFSVRQSKRLLIVEGAHADGGLIGKLIGDDPELKIRCVSNTAEALHALDEEDVDCMVVDLRLPGRTGLDVIQAVQARAESGAALAPIVTYNAQHITREQTEELAQLAQRSVVKDVRSPERLLDETALLLHRPTAKLPVEKRAILQKLSEADPALHDKRVLVVDDDARNLFAITTILEQHAMQVRYAENGREALRKLAEQDVDIVLMDIMMPEMDGYEAMRRIRLERDSKELPIIALTAKAMQGDREKCLQAGASDYITKPIDADQLVSLLRVWLYR
jgi:HAMP domain-containing protein/signal transduction histidine kinase/CheY-like chemotaxis protein